MPHLKQHFHSKTPQCDALSDGDVEIEPYKSLQLGGLLNGDLQQKTFVPTLGLEMIFGNDSKDYLQIPACSLPLLASLGGSVFLDILPRKIHLLLLVIHFTASYPSLLTSYLISTLEMIIDVILHLISWQITL
jgi:hypothetical protein